MKFFRALPRYFRRRVGCDFYGETLRVGDRVRPVSGGLDPHSAYEIVGRWGPLIELSATAYGMFRLTTWAAPKQVAIIPRERRHD